MVLIVVVIKKGKLVILGDDFSVLNDDIDCEICNESVKWGDVKVVFVGCSVVMICVCLDKCLIIFDFILLNVDIVWNVVEVFVVGVNIILIFFVFLGFFCGGERIFVGDDILWFFEFKGKICFDEEEGIICCEVFVVMK